MDKKIITFSTEIGKYSDTFTLTESELSCRWEKAKESGESSIQLSNLQPRVVHLSGRPDGTMQRIVFGGVLLSIAVIVYFSALQALAPLLSFGIATWGFVYLIQGIKNWKIEHYTIFMTKDNTRYRHIILRSCNPQKLEQFEAAFEDQCEAAQYK